MIIVDYEKETGRILGVLNYPFDDYEKYYPGALFLGNSAIVSDLLHYVKDGRLEDRPNHGVTLEGNLLRGVMDGSTIIIGTDEYLADGTDIELEFGHAGPFQIRVEKFPYLDFEVTYHED